MTRMNMNRLISSRCDVLDAIWRQNKLQTASRRFSRRSSLSLSFARLLCNQFQLPAKTMIYRGLFMDGCLPYRRHILNYSLR